MHPARALVALIVGGVLAAGLPSPASAAPAPTAPIVQPTAQEFYWEWSDGADAKRRTFRESEYELPENLPQLIVAAEPAKPQQYVKLQYKQGSTWRREDAGLTNGKGMVRLSLNPYCEDGSWCDGTYKYRLLVNGQYTVFTITYES